jgi:hypothetical protein
VGAAEPDMVGPAVDELDIGIGVIRLLDAGIHFRAVEEPTQLIHLGDIDKFPLDKLFVIVIEPVLFSFPDIPGLFEGFEFVVCGDETELFVKLGSMTAVPADDPENDLTKIPVHIYSFYILG